MAKAQPPNLLDKLLEPEPPKGPRWGPLTKLTQEQIVELNQALQAIRDKPPALRPSERRMANVLGNHYGVKFSPSTIHKWIYDGLPEGSIRQTD